MPSNRIDRQSIVVASALCASLESSTLEYECLKPNALIVETQQSVISAGTELAILKGLESWAPFPFTPGYAAVGRVIDRGEAVTKFDIGDMVFTHGNHSSVHLINDGFAVKVPDGMPGGVASLAARMGQVAITSLRVSQPELGDFVVVQGLGLVGNLAAQLFTLAGCRVIGVDVSEKRLQVARTCGIEFTVNANDNPQSAINSITGAEMAQIVVEASGVPTLVGTAARFAAHGGQLILLGTPRGVYEGNARDLLMLVHESNTALTIKGAHEWVYPIKPTTGSKHSIERNVKQLLDLVLCGKLHVQELISHVIKPGEVPRVYHELLNRNDDYFGVVIDWTATA